jgi:hypothetical protein
MPSRILIRTIKFKSYSKGTGRFRHQDIFEPYGGGISIFIEECALETSSLCQHIARFYPNTVDNPVFYWKIREESLLQYEGFNGISVIQSESAPNAEGEKDPCHHDITVTDVASPEFRTARRSFAQEFCKPPHIFICIEGVSRQLSNDEYENLQKWVVEKELL